VSNIAKAMGIESSNNPGRPNAISTSLGRLILRSFLLGTFQTAVDAEKALRGQGHKISAETIRRFLKSNKFDSKIKKEALPLTPIRKKNRLAWAKKYRSWTAEDWKKVVFSDETKINRLGSDGKQWTWVKKGDALRDHNVNMTYKHGGGSLMLWGCFTVHGPGFIAKIDGGMDSKLYCDILEGDFMETLKDYGMNLDDVILQQDNDPKHKSKYTTNWMQENNINVLDWPSYSPDMNPIENLWFYLKCQLAAYDTPPTSIAQLWERVGEVWYSKVTSELCLKLINGMPERLEAVIKAKGGATKW
jgi:transposase